MNKYLFIGLILLSAIIIGGCTVQSGSVNDKVFSVDKGIVWDHVYFVNDHSTTYCLDKDAVDDYNFLKNSNSTVRVDYNKNFMGEGFFCSGQGESETVIITKVHR